jgi:DNA-binding cell septation regulator SpoVG
MKISKVKIKKVAPKDGLVGFASCVIDDSLYLGNIAVFTRLNQVDKIRLVFPVKELDNIKIAMFKPLTSDLYYALEVAIADKYFNE